MANDPEVAYTGFLIHKESFMTCPCFSTMDRPTLVAFEEVARDWRLSVTDQGKLLGMAEVPQATGQRGAAATVDPETEARIAYVLRIHQALRALFPTAVQADSWVHRPNRAPWFDGQPALQRMMAGPTANLARVAHYLEAQVNG
jgi:uncharacterized protein (DUF2384 family)